MSKLRRFAACAVAVAALAPLHAAEYVPFRGTWTGATLSADPFTSFPVVIIVAGGGGTFNQLGRATMVSPHTTNVFTGETIGPQIFTAANGDQLTADCAGFASPGPDGVVRGSLDCTITGGTGRFAAATGSYTFTLTATAQENGPGFDTVAQIDGQISSVGSRR